MGLFGKVKGIAKKPIKLVTKSGKKLGGETNSVFRAAVRYDPSEPLERPAAKVGSATRRTKKTLTPGAKGAGRKLVTPLKHGLEWSSQTQYATAHTMEAVRHAKAGRWKKAGTSARRGVQSNVNFLTLRKGSKDNKLYPSQTGYGQKAVGHLPERTRVPGLKNTSIPTRAVGEFAIDWAADPVTWVTFGTGGGVKGLGTVGQRTLVQGAKTGQGVGSRTAARAAASRAARIRQGGNVAELRVKIPFTGNRSFGTGVQFSNKVVRDKWRNFQNRGQRWSGRGTDMSVSASGQATPKSNRIVRNLARFTRGAQKGSASGGHAREVHDIYRAAGHGRSGQEKLLGQEIGRVEAMVKMGRKKKAKGREFFKTYEAGKQGDAETAFARIGRKMLTAERREGIKTPELGGKPWNRYAPHVVDDIAGNDLAAAGRIDRSSPMAAFKQQRGVGTRAEKQAKSHSTYVEDPFDAMAQRASASLVGREAKAAEDAVLETFGVSGQKIGGKNVVQGLGPQLQRGTRELDDLVPWAREHGPGEKLVPRDVAAQMAHESQNLAATTRFNANDVYNKGVRALIGLNTSRKAQMLASPRRIIRDRIDETIMGQTVFAGKRMGRVGMGSHRQAARMLRGKDPQKVRTLAGGEKVTNTQLRDLLEGTGVTRQGQASELKNTLGQGVTGARNPLTGTVERVNSALDDTQRAATTMDLVAQGYSLDEAARIARRAHIDFGDVSPLLARTRNLAVPFATFTAKSTPQIGRAAFGHPGSLSRLNTVMDYSQDAAGNPDLEHLPPWLASSFATPTNAAMNWAFQGSDDNPLTKNPARTLRIGAVDELSPVTADADGTHLDWEAAGRGTLAKFGPLIKSPIELAAGYDSFKGQRFDEGKRPVAGAQEKLALKIPGMDKILKPERDASGRLTISPQANKIVESFTPLAQQLRPLISETSNVLGGPGSDDEFNRRKLMRWLTGADVTPYDEAQQLKFTDARRKREESKKAKKPTAAGGGGADFSVDEIDIDDDLFDVDALLEDLDINVD